MSATESVNQLEEEIKKAWLIYPQFPGSVFVLSNEQIDGYFIYVTHTGESVEEYAKRLYESNDSLLNPYKIELVWETPSKFALYHLMCSELWFSRITSPTSSLYQIVSVDYIKLLGDCFAKHINHFCTSKSKDSKNDEKN